MLHDVAVTVVVLHGSVVGITGVTPCSVAGITLCVVSRS